jgi:hypothetical protein
LKEEAKLQLDLPDFLVYTCDIHSFQALFKGQQEIFSFLLDLQSAPLKVVCSSSDLYIQSESQLVAVDVRPFLQFFQPHQATFTDLATLKSLLEFTDKRLERCRQDWKAFHTKFQMQTRSIRDLLQSQTLAKELEDLSLRGTLSPSMKQWIRDELTNTQILNNLFKSCEQQLKQIADELLLRVQPSVSSALEIVERVTGRLQAKCGFQNRVSSLGFSLKTLGDVGGLVSGMSVLAERMLMDVCCGGKDTKMLLKFLNNLCIEQAGDQDVTNLNNELSKDVWRATSQKLLKVVTQSDPFFTPEQLLMLEHIRVYLEEGPAIPIDDKPLCAEQAPRQNIKALSQLAQNLVQEMMMQPRAVCTQLVRERENIQLAFLDSVLFQEEVFHAAKHRQNVLFFSLGPYKPNERNEKQIKYALFKCPDCFQGRFEAPTSGELMFIY